MELEIKCISYIQHIYKQNLNQQTPMQEQHPMLFRVCKFIMNFSKTWFESLKQVYIHPYFNTIQFQNSKSDVSNLKTRFNYIHSHCIDKIHEKELLATIICLPKTEYCPFGKILYIRLPTPEGPKKFCILTQIPCSHILEEGRVIQ